MSRTRTEPSPAAPAMPPGRAPRHRQRGLFGLSRDGDDGGLAGAHCGGDRALTRGGADEAARQKSADAIAGQPADGRGLTFEGETVMAAPHPLGRLRFFEGATEVHRLIIGGALLRAWTPS